MACRGSGRTLQAEISTNRPWRLRILEHGRPLRIQEALTNGIFFKFVRCKTVLSPYSNVESPSFRGLWSRGFDSRRLHQLTY